MMLLKLLYTINSCIWFKVYKKGMIDLKVTIQSIFIIIGLVVATILGVSAQSISYYINEQMPIISLATSITIVTLLSIGLFIFIPSFLFISKKLGKELATVFLVLTILIGLPISGWSFFVWAMWMG
ncbi:hypothetical protein [Oceanobacillus kapialis]|uniref:hypothetical protein n=1 Tax=Oceanobacillus kapialis TaxID=481353 RepID=UPI00384D1554